MDKMENKIEKVFEDFSRETVPQDKTKNWLSMGLIWAGVGISLGLLLTGGTMGDGLTIKQTIVAAFIGGFVLALITLFIGIIGQRTGLSTAMISRLHLVIALYLLLLLFKRLDLMAG